MEDQESGDKKRVEYPAEIDTANKYELFAYQVVSEIVSRKISTDEELLDLLEEAVTQHGETLEFERMLEIVANIKKELNSKPIAVAPDDQTKAPWR